MKIKFNRGVDFLLGGSYLKKILILIAMLCLLTGCFGNDNKEVKKTEIKKEEASNTTVEKKPVKTMENFLNIL